MTQTLAARQRAAVDRRQFAYLLRLWRRTARVMLQGESPRHHGAAQGIGWAIDHLRLELRLSRDALARRRSEE